MTVTLVGAGPGDADLLTVRAARLLAEAEVVVFDRLVDPSILALAPATAEMIDVGKTPGRSTSQAMINELLISLGRRYERVVRLKGGDPFVFGRGGEELHALRDAGVTCDVVPGVTSALSAPLAAGIPVTHREVARGVTVVTGHVVDGEGSYFEQLANPEITLVILMGVAHRQGIQEQLLRGGLAPTTPIAVVERAWTARQREVRGVLCNLASLDVAAPAVIVVGAVAAMDLRRELAPLLASVGS